MSAAVVERGPEPEVGCQVRFCEEGGDEFESLGVITRVWPHGNNVTVSSDGRTFVRHRQRVIVCNSLADEVEALLVANWHNEQCSCNRVPCATFGKDLGPHRPWSWDVETVLAALRVVQAGACR